MFLHPCRLLSTSLEAEEAGSHDILNIFKVCNSRSLYSWSVRLTSSVTRMCRNTEECVTSLLSAKVHKTVFCLYLDGIVTTKMKTKQNKTCPFKAGHPPRQFFSKVILRASSGENYLGLSKEDLIPQGSSVSTVSVSLSFSQEYNSKEFSQRAFTKHS